ncbi:fatty acid synthase-like isoform X2 [Planococcus citri]|uniref:fatty acid synthase-like isoform X2 n=1 Tax=Planococcus citri TaxID=170843 RepID=UPI0031F79E67
MSVKSDQSEAIVVSGISGVFPNSENVGEFVENLYSGKDMVSDYNRYGKKIRTGLLKTIDRFDHSFFHVTRQQAEGMIIAARLLIEKAFEAVLDAGYNPEQIKGKNIAVICGVWDTCDDGDPAKNLNNFDDYAQTLGRCQFMLANRISFYLDVNGPSIGINTACSSSMHAFDYAFHAIKNGRCEAAIVISPNFCLSDSENFHPTVLNSHSGTYGPFDANANGYVKSEASVAVFLQKRKDARRVYANVIHTKTKSEGFKEEGPWCPSIKQQKELYRQFYEEVGTDPQCISYLEAHATGTQVGDVVESTSIEEFFCTERETPLKIGSVKSNMGHGEAAAALCSLVKLIASFETGLIAPNINYNSPNPNIKGLHNGHLEVVAKPTPLEGEYYAINSFGAGGSIGHILLTPNGKQKTPRMLSHDKLPRLVTVSGRTEEAVDCILNDIEKHQNDSEYIRLIHEVFSNHISGHLYRGFITLNKGKEFTRSKKFFSGEKRPIWFVFSGMGSQWPSMGKSLMKIPIFAESIRKSYEILQKKEIDLMKIITDEDPQVLDNILHCFVGITAIQIALVDILKSLNIKPDGMIGHSVGELGCAYADECLTAEQVILAAYYRGLVSIKEKLISGTMAAVGKNYKDIKDILPPEIDISCHNSATNCTISGPTTVVKPFIDLLKNKDIFVREVNTAHIAYHSRYIASAGTPLESFLNKIIPEPKLRSKKWISTSRLEHEWDSTEAKYSSAKYLTNNLLNTVYFEESCKYIPSDAIVIEIGARDLLSRILKQALPFTVENIPLTTMGHDNSVVFLLNSLGKMYEAGCVPKCSNLYPSVEFPVSRSTPMISPLIKWLHDEEWPMGKLDSETSVTADRILTVNPTSDNFSFVTDHIIDGINLYPGLGYLSLVWEAIATVKRKTVTNLPIVFENVRFERATIVPKKGPLKFRVIVQIATNHFEITENEAAVASGIVKVPENIDEEVIKMASYDDDQTDDSEEDLPLDKKDFYKELRLRGYNYKGVFKNVICANSTGTRGKVSWNGNFVPFMDSMAQISILQLDCRELLIPTFIEKVVIDVGKHYQILQNLDSDTPEFPVNLNPTLGVISSGGVQMQGWKMSQIARRQNAADPALEKHHFVPYINEEVIDLNRAVRICVHIALQNAPTIKVKTYELLDGDYDPEINIISSTIANTLADLPLVEANINIVTEREISPETVVPNEITIMKRKLPQDKSALLVVLEDFREKTDHFEQILGALKVEGFIIAVESLANDICFEELGLNICFSRVISDQKKILLLNKKTQNLPSSTIIKVTNESYSWLSEVQNAIINSKSTQGEELVVYSQKEPMNGILGFFNCLKRERKAHSSRCFFIMDNNAPEFSLKDPFYKTQFNTNLSHNVYKNGTWGTYLHLPIEQNSEVQVAHAFCVLEEVGNLSSFRWTEASHRYANSDAKPVAHVYFSSLNFKDIMMAVRKFSAVDLAHYNRLQDNYRGVEYSGRDQSGKRIMGISNKEAKATVVEIEPEMTWKVPDNMTLEEAATIPVIYETVIFAFFFKMNLQKESTVLIHAGSGGIGQAAINICLHYKCNIFTTVGTPEKVQFIRKTYPQIPANQIGNSRDTSFKSLIMKQTNGRGVDVVLNSLTGEKLKASVSCVAKEGHFLDIGKFDMIQNNPLELKQFLNNISYHGIHLDVIIQDKSKILLEIQSKFQKMLDKGIIKPIQRTIFQMNQVESAFRYMAAGKHVGKVLIKIREEEKDLNAKPISMNLKVKPCVWYQENETCVIIGGLGGLGMELADWLILRGVRNLVLGSRTGIQHGYQSYRIKLWRSYGVKVIISTEDITNETGVKNLLNCANSLAPVAGIYNLAVILQDDSILNQTEDSFRAVCEPKAIATIHLDKLSRKMCPKLAHFVVFSSFACGRGNIHQTNYGFANSVMERICEARKADNLHALAVQWGAVGEVGIVADLAEYDRSVIIVCF